MTDSYAPFEQVFHLESEICQATDLHALAATFVELLTGQAIPNIHDRMSESGIRLEQIVRKEVALPEIDLAARFSDVPVFWTNALGPALAFDVSRRTGSAAELSSAIERERAKPSVIHHKPGSEAFDTIILKPEDLLPLHDDSETSTLSYRSTFSEEPYPEPIGWLRQKLERFIVPILVAVVVFLAATFGILLYSSISTRTTPSVLATAASDLDRPNTSISEQQDAQSSPRGVEETTPEICPTKHLELRGRCVTPQAPGEWVAIEKGSFKQGSPSSEIGRGINEDLHPVTLTQDYLLQATEVTRRQFRAVMGYLPPSEFASCDDCPVDSVSWHEAALYANELSKRAQLPLCYSCAGSRERARCELASKNSNPVDCRGFRLPTEAEWEYAARAGTPTATYAGDLDPAHLGCEPTNPIFDQLEWFCGNSQRRTHLVKATKAPNPFGLYDMLGNVREWGFEVYRPAPADIADPWGPRVIRGGGWGYFAKFSRAASRGWNISTDRSSKIGFRIARTLDQ